MTVNNVIKDTIWTITGDAKSCQIIVCKLIKMVYVQIAVKGFIWIVSQIAISYLTIVQMLI